MTPHLYAAKVVFTQRKETKLKIVILLIYKIIGRNPKKLGSNPKKIWKKSEAIEEEISKISGRNQNYFKKKSEKFQEKI